jgi:3-oxoacyl-[acyl-carrier protein] reductase
MIIDLSGKIAIVTGATGQLGRVMVRTLASCGADVAIHYRSSADMALALCEEVKAMGRRALAVQADVTDWAQVQALRDTVVNGLGWPDIVVDNAVIQYKWTTVLEQGNEDFESKFRSCVMQNVHMAKAFVPHMVQAGYGRFIGINTECSMLSLPGQAAYVSGKRGPQTL